MKKNVLLIAVALVGSLSTYAQVKFGVKAGFNLANVTQKYDGKKEDGNKSMPGFHAGVIADISLAENFALQPGLLYSSKGVKNEFKEDVAGVSFKETSKTSLGYIEIPVNFLYKHQLGAGKFFGGFGPYVAFGLSGKTKFTIDPAPATKVEDVKIKFDGKKAPSTEDPGYADYEKYGHLKRLDAGANFTVGYELNSGLLFGVNYSLGLTNIDIEDKASTKNRYFGISVGYLFGGKKK